MRSTTGMPDESPSNALVDGGSLDYGTQTALPDFQKVKVLSDESYFGDTLMQKTDLLNEIVNDLAKNLPEELRGAVPTPAQAAKLFDDAYVSQQTKEILALTGIPQEMLDEAAGSPQGKALAQTLLRMAHAGQEEVIEPKGELIKRRGTYRLDLILERLVNEGFSAKPDVLEKLVTRLVPNSQDRSELVERMALFLQTARNIARAGARSNPSVTSDERGFIGLLMADHDRGIRPVDPNALPISGTMVACAPADSLRWLFGS